MKLRFTVPDMSCGHCKKRIEEALVSRKGIESLSVDLDSKTVTVETELSPEEIISVIDEAGYDATEL